MREAIIINVNSFYGFSDILEFSACHYQLMPFIEEMEEAENNIPEDGSDSEPEPEGTGESDNVPDKRYGMASGRRFNMNKFKSGDYDKRFGMASGRNFKMNKFKSGGYDKRFGMASGRNFKMSKFKSGDYNKRYGMASGNRFNMNKFKQGNYVS